MKFKPGDRVDYTRGSFTSTGHKVLDTPPGVKLNYGERHISNVVDAVPVSKLSYTKGVRRHLPDERKGLTHKFEVDGIEVFLRTGEYDDGSLGELFITVAKEGDEWRAYDYMATAMSIGLQYSIPNILEAFIKKFEHTRMKPQGITDDPEIPIAKSIGDYVARWLRLRYLPCEDGEPLSESEASENETNGDSADKLDDGLVDGQGSGAE
jgi:hypothetical protein